MVLVKEISMSGVPILMYPQGYYGVEVISPRGYFD